MEGMQEKKRSVKLVFGGTLIKPNTSRGEWGVMKPQRGLLKPMGGKGCWTEGGEGKGQPVEALIGVQ